MEDVHKDHPSPSKAADNAKLLANQMSTNPHAVFNGRPMTLAGPSLSIYHPIFQRFMQKYSARVDFAGVSQKDIIIASKLMADSARYYEKEIDRLVKISPHLEYFLGTQWEGRLRTEDQSWVPNGCNRVACPLFGSGGRGVLSPVSLLFELENGIGAGHTDPVEQAEQGYFLLCTSSKEGAFDWLNDGPSDLVYRWDHSADETACLYSFLGWRDLISGCPARYILTA